MCSPQCNPGKTSETNPDVLSGHQLDLLLSFLDSEAIKSIWRSLEDASFQEEFQATVKHTVNEAIKYQPFSWPNLIEEEGAAIPNATVIRLKELLHETYIEIEPIFDEQAIFKALQTDDVDGLKTALKVEDPKSVYGIARLRSPHLDDANEL